MKDMMYLHGRNYHKKRLKHFWSQTWLWGYSTTVWMAALRSGHDGKYKSMISDFIRILALEDKISISEAENLKAMIDSPDPENYTICLMILEKHKPGKFDNNINKLPN